jgi:Skp family chaperone for outer membrane proteins
MGGANGGKGRDRRPSRDEENRTVKRTVILAAGVVALSGAILYVSGVGAQAPTGARPAAPSSRIALLNLSHVIKNYDKFKAFQAELKAAVEPFQKRDAAAKAEADDIAKKFQSATTPPDAATREAQEKRLKELQRIVEDNKAEAAKVLAKKQEDQLQILYMDVREVAERHAQANGFEMVLHYNDATEAKEYWSAQNISRKMTAGALIPLYYTRGIDISGDVIASLNAVYKSKGNAGTTPTSTTPATTPH